MMRKILSVFVALFLFTSITFAANTNTQTRSLQYVSTWTLTFDSTGIECVFVDGKPHVYIIVEETTDGATYDIEANPSDSPAEYSDATLTDLPGASDLTASYGGWVTIGAPYMCVRVTACSTCGVTATINAFGVLGDHK